MAEHPKPELMLVDGLNMVYRNQHRLGHLSTSSGKASGAFYGSARSLIAMLNEFTPNIPPRT